MDLLLRGRGADIGARAPLWLVRLSGAALAYGSYAIADRLGLPDVLGVSRPLLGGGALLAGALLAPTAWGALLWAVTGALVAVSMLVAFTPVVRAPALHFVRNDPAGAPVEAVIVLSGSMTEDGLLNGQVLERLLSALAEARRLHVPEMAMSVIEDERNNRRISSETDQRALMSLLAPDMTVRFVHTVASTRDEALQFSALANTYRWRRVAVVTSPMHTRRACRTFEVAGLSVQCVAAHSRTYSLARLRSSGARLDAFQDLMYETAATLLYSVRGWM